MPAYHEDLIRFTQLCEDPGVALDEYQPGFNDELRHNVVATDLTSPGGPYPVPQTEAVDHAILEQLRTDLEDEDGSALASLVDIYLADLPTLMADLTFALTAADTAAAAHLAHSLRSPTALLGAGPLATLLQHVEDFEENRRSQRPDHAALAQAISHEGDRVVAELSRLDWSA